MLVLKDEEIERLKAEKFNLAERGDLNALTSKAAEVRKETQIEKLEYVRNMFFKYLELRYCRKKDKEQSRTVE